MLNSYIFCPLIQNQFAFAENRFRLPRKSPFLIPSNELNSSGMMVKYGNLSILSLDTIILFLKPSQENPHIEAISRRKVSIFPLTISQHLESQTVEKLYKNCVYWHIFSGDVFTSAVFLFFIIM